MEIVVFLSTKSVCLNFIFIYFFNPFVKRRQLCCHISDLGCDRKDMRGNKENVGNRKEGYFFRKINVERLVIVLIEFHSLIRQKTEKREIKIVLQK